MDFVNTYISEKSIKLATDVLRSTYVSAGKLADKLKMNL